MAESAEEWLRQADYDLDTAQYMLQGGRRFYAVFMAHLAVEKALKGVYQHRLNRVPPKTHNLLYLVDEIELTINDQTRQFLARLTQQQILARYPDQIREVLSAFTDPIVRNILIQSSEVIQWAKTLL